MNRERRSSLAIGVAVFIAGGVLLGLEIASSRVLAPFFGNSLYVWGSLIGVVLAGLSTGLLARRHRGRPLSRRHACSSACSARPRCSCSRSRSSTAGCSTSVDWLGPGPRLNPLIATILLFGLPSLVLGSVSPSPCA